jgi:Heavy metal binding domain
MHPEVTSEQPRRCPKCGMKLLASRTSGQRQGGHKDVAIHHDVGNVGVWALVEGCLGTWENPGSLGNGAVIESRMAPESALSLGETLQGGTRN